MMKVKVGGIYVDFLYDPGSQFTIISRNVYDNLGMKPPLQPAGRGGVGITGSTSEGNFGEITFCLERRTFWCVQNTS